MPRWSSRVLLAVVAAGTQLALAMALAPSPSDAAVFAPLTRIHDEQVNGDFTISGNAVLVCPVAAGTARTECLAASRRGNSFNNNRFAMTYADVDPDPTTYNSSTASVTIPAGAHATYARLQWGGNRDGQQCGVGAAGTYPPGSAATQQVRLTVGDAATRDVSPAGYTTDTASVGYYSADADVSDAFADLPDGRPVTVTVGNVFAPTGLGCWGGWSVTVVYDTPDAGCAVQRREVFVYDGHVRQGVSDPPLDATVAGLRVAGTPAHLGVTAFEGDSGQTGDQLLLNGTNLPEPNTGALANFFNSTADHQGSPDYPNNFSIDATSLTVPSGVIAPGDTSAALQVRTSGDAFLLTGLALSVPVPSLCIEKSVSPAAAHPGDPLTWTIRVSNPSTADATGVAVADVEVPGCARAVGALAAGQESTYTCTSTAPADDLTNTATVTGTDAGGGALSDTARATVDVLHPAIAVSKTASAAVVRAGHPVTWTIRVDNTGDTPLDPVAVDDDVVDACDRRDLGPLAAGADTTYDCTGTVTADLTNTATATGTDGLGLGVSDTASASVTTEAPAITITKAADVERAAPGDLVTWSLQVRNTGSVPLADVSVTDPQTPGCDRTSAALAVGATEQWTCTSTAGTDDLRNTATVTATSPAGFDVTDRATATVDVTEPAARVDITTTPEVPEEGTPFTVSIDVVNTGDVALEDGVLELTGAPGCDDDDFSVPAGGSTRVTCETTVDETTELAAEVELQPVLDGRQVGDALVVRASLVVRPATADTPTVADPHGGATPGAAVLPATGASGALLPLGVLGLLLVGAGAWTVRRALT
ncbi:DUF7507 domain-containing protein [Nocardioides sp. URHA0020]|uniref:DUF7507 domain-containing protein n=1 Tax=Nocardioides sp. URHA0020 TaxID=1380392 RepID=UPI000686BC44|nr:DUF11 domain-containing protein [Nocardioides sp. URHA0020]